MAPGHLPHGYPCDLYPILVKSLLSMEACKVGSSDVDLDVPSDEVFPGAFSQYASSFLSVMYLASAFGKSLTVCSLGVV